MIIGRSKLVTALQSRASGEPAAPVPEPDDYALSVKKISPDQIGGTVIIEVSSE